MPLAIQFFIQSTYVYESSIYYQEAFGPFLLYLGQLMQIIRTAKSLPHSFLLIIVNTVIRAVISTSNKKITATRKKIVLPTFMNKGWYLHVQINTKVRPFNLFEAINPTVIMSIFVARCYLSVHRTMKDRSWFRVSNRSEGFTLRFSWTCKPGLNNNCLWYDN